jgi:polar amino acid transport system substrate-binding protein
VLGGRLKNATLVPVASLGEAQRMLQGGALDAFATNKGILFEMSDALPGSRVMEGRWGLENLAIAIPKGRDVARPYLQDLAQTLQGNGFLASAIQRSGLRGTARD